ncbi:MAG: hypothetical protein FWC64_05370 [Treponema sp.]|nr:hypothetical protein [Treponema sp.]
MTKKNKAVYAPGELSRVREKLGVSNLEREEAELLIKKLGGEVGYEKSDVQDPAWQRARRERVHVKIGDRPSYTSPPNRERTSLDIPDISEEMLAKGKALRKKDIDPADDPSVPVKASYWDRIKMDRFAGQSEFDIKSPMQVFQSMISLFGDVPDYVSPLFAARRMPEYYRIIEVLVLSTRNLLPRNNLLRTERLKKSAPLAYSILDTIRHWDIEKISSELARIQGSSRNARVSDFAGILRAVYRPLFILELLDMDAHIRGAYKVLYKLLYLENPAEAERKCQEPIRTALSAFSGIRLNVHYLLYPLLMKALSASYVPYERFFTERKNRIMSLLNVTEDDQINPAALAMQGLAKDDKPDSKPQRAQAAGGQDSSGGSEAAGGTEAESGGNSEVEDEGKEKEISEEEKSRRASQEAEKRALDRGLKTLEILFPAAGWERLPSYPDLYPYFADTLGMKRGVVNVAPTDPMQQVIVLMHILEELFFAVRHVSFGSTRDPAGGVEELSSSLGGIINNWRYYIETSIGKEYLPRLADHVRVLEGPREEHASMYNKRVITELHWLKRLYFLPFYKFESLVPPPFRKGEIEPLYAEIRKLRKYFSVVAAGIERGTRAGGAEARAFCDGINNPWEPYVFEIPNPLSMRLDALLGPKTKNNAALVYFSLAVTTVLDHLLNNEKSWAYSPRPGPLFRSVNGEGTSPLTGVDDRVNADALFRQALRRRQARQARTGNE